MKAEVITEGITFITTGSARPVTEYETKRQRVNRDGQPLWSVRLLALYVDGENEASELITVRVASPAAPRVPKRGMPVQLVGLTVRSWSMRDRSGLSFEAARIEPLQPATGASSGSSS